MNKAEYIKWKSERGEDAAKWERHKCYAADALIRKQTLANLAKRLKGIPEPEKGYIELMARCHFGSSETDEFLMALKAYPEWM